MLINFETKLISKNEIAPSIYFLSYAWPENSDFSFNAGQYMIFHIKNSENMISRRLYSIASSPLFNKSLDFIVEVLNDGVGSNYFKQTKIGDMLTMQGPAGLFTLKDTSSDVVFLATGTGIAPIYSMIETSLHNNSNIKHNLFWGLKTKKDVYLINKLNDLKNKHSNFDYKICLSREILPVNQPLMLGHVNDGLSKLLTEKNKTYSNYTYYLCGGKNAVESIKTDLMQKGAEEKNIHFERFS